MTSKLILLAELMIPSVLIARDFLKKKKNDLANKLNKEKADKAVIDAIDKPKTNGSVRRSNHYHSSGHHHHHHGQHDTNDDLSTNVKHTETNIDKPFSKGKTSETKIYKDMLTAKWQYLWISLVIGLVIVITLILNRSYN